MSKVLNIVRELTDRAAKLEEQRLIDASLHIITPPIISYHIATTKNSAKYHEHFDGEQLFSFILAQQSILKNSETVKSFSSLVSFAVSYAVDNIIFQNCKDTYIKIINAAHNGDASAMRAIGNFYQHGISGFPQDTQLAQAWFQSGALEGDVASMALVAISYFEGGHLAPAWAFVKVIEDLEASDDNSNAIARQLKQVIESNPHKEQIQQQGEDLAIDFFQRSEERMKWRLQSKGV